MTIVPQAAINPPTPIAPAIPIARAISTNSVSDFLDVWTKGSEADRLYLWETMLPGEIVFLSECWELFAHPHQVPPLLAQNGEPWLTWLLIGGRGAGKTRAGAEWVRAQALGKPPFADRAAGRIALVGETEHDVREVMIEGVSGILSVHARGERPLWTPSRRRLEWANGAIAEVFSAEDPESLRGPQFHCAWSDEMAKWRQAEAAFDMLQFGLRLGHQPKQLITTTARPSALLKRLLADPGTAVTRAATAANAFHLAPTFLTNVMTRYAGTRLGRQELNGEIIDDRPDALWSRALLEQCRVDVAPELQRIVVAWIRRRHRPSAPMPAVSWPRGLRRVASSMCWPMTASAARRRPCGRARRSRSGGGLKRMRWWSRSIRAATWCAR